MIVYLFSYIVVFLMAIKDSLRGCCLEVYGYRYTLFFFLLLSLLVGIRDMIGGYDVYVYGAFFDEIEFDNIQISALLFEPGFVLYNFIVKLLFGNRYIFFLITSLITYFLFYKNISKYSSFVYLSLFLLYCKLFLMSFVYVRQCMAMGIVWFSIPYAIDKKAIKFIMVILLGMSFHVSAVIFSFVYFIARTRLSSLTMTIVVVLSLILGITPFVKVALSFIGDYFYITKASSYGENDLGGINYFYLLESILLSIMLLVFRSRLYNLSKMSIAMTNIFLIYICLSAITLREPTSVRIIWYYLVSMFCVIPDICALSYKYGTYLRLCIMMYFSIAFFRILVLWDNGDFMPYKTFFTNGQRVSIWNDQEYDRNYAENKFYKW